jgi:thiamine biosynthesis lipoprotein
MGGTVASEVTRELRHSFTALGTVVTIHVVGSDSDAREAVERASGWFEHVERTCSRFDPDSELSRLCSRIGERVNVSPLLYEALRFSLALQRKSEGAFDPSVGARMEALGFDRHHTSGERVRHASAGPGSFVSLRMTDEERTVYLEQPMVIDLGAVAKGLAIDLAAQELAEIGNFVVDAGGDGYFGGFNSAGEQWSVGIRHPREAGAIIETLTMSNGAVCTSGDYERVNTTGAHHLVDPRGGPADACASVTVIAPMAMVADGFATAAFVLGPERGIEFLQEQGAEGLIFTPELERFETAGLSRYRKPA